MTIHKHAYDIIFRPVAILCKPGGHGNTASSRSLVRCDQVGANGMARNARFHQAYTIRPQDLIVKL